MKTFYSCDYCKKQFNSKRLCESHESKCSTATSMENAVAYRLTNILNFYKDSGYVLNVHYNSDNPDGAIIFVHVPRDKDFV